MDGKTLISTTATPAAPDKIEAKVPEAKVPEASPVTVSTTAVPENVTTSVAISTDTEWKITIRNSDGTESAVMLSPVSPKTPTRQEIRIVMPGAKAMTGEADAEADKNPKTELAAKYSRKMRIYIIIQQSLTAIFSIVIITIMALTLAKYNSTKSVTGAWPTNALLTPTIVLLIMACLTCIADIITVLVNCCNVKIGNSMMRVVAKIRAVMSFLQAIASAGGTGYFKFSNNTSGGNDLWGWSCSDAADAMASVNSSGQLCQNNTVAFALGVLQIVLHVLAVVMAVWALMKPAGEFKDHVNEATQLLQDDMDVETKYTTNLIGGGDAKK